LPADRSAMATAVHRRRRPEPVPRGRRKKRGTASGHSTAPHRRHDDRDFLGRRHRNGDEVPRQKSRDGLNPHRRAAGARDVCRSAPWWVGTAELSGRSPRFWFRHRNQTRNNLTCWRRRGCRVGQPREGPGGERGQRRMVGRHLRTPYANFISQPRRRLNVDAGLRLRGQRRRAREPAGGCRGGAPTGTRQHAQRRREWKRRRE